MMVTDCISTDALSSVFISPDLADTNSFRQCCWSIMPVTACSYRLQQSVPNIPVTSTYLLSFCYIRLIQPWQPNRLFQSDAVSSEQSVGDNSLIQAHTGMISYMYRAWRCQKGLKVRPTRRRHKICPPRMRSAFLSYLYFKGQVS